MELDSELTKSPEHALDDEYVYALRDLLGPILRMGMKRARNPKHNQSLAAERIANVEKAVLEIGLVLVKKSAAQEAAASAAASGEKARGRPRKDGERGNGSYEGDTFPT